MTVMHYFGIKATSNIMQNRAELFCGTVTTDTDYLQSSRAMKKYLEYALPHSALHTYKLWATEQNKTKKVLFKVYTFRGRHSFSDTSNPYI